MLDYHGDAPSPRCKAPRPACAKASLRRGLVRNFSDREQRTCRSTIHGSDQGQTMTHVRLYAAKRRASNR
jgi:hypothetical protein